MELVLVRHTSLVIEKDICYGQSEVLPAQTFMTEAEVIKEQLNGIDPEMIYTSPLSRCTMLASQTGFSNAVENELLLEYNFGDWEMMPWNTIHGLYAERWMNDYINVPAPNGENMIDMVNRMETFIDHVRNTGHEIVLAFTHAGPIRIARHLINGAPLEEVFNEKVGYGSINHFKL